MGTNGMNYIVMHWRGQQGLLRSVLLNGVLTYLVMVALLVSLGTAFKPSGGIFVGLGLFLIWEVWAAVGIFHCAMRYAFDRDRGTVERVGGLISILGVAAVAYFSSVDMWRLGFLSWVH
jgi:hypothetical protein